MQVTTTTPAVGRRPRAFVGVGGPQATDYLQRMLSNDVAALALGESCEALLLTPKARVIAPIVVLRRGAEDFLLLTEPELGDVALDHLRRMRFAARAEIQPEQHSSHVLFSPVAPEGAPAVPTGDYGVPAFEVIDVPEPASALRVEDEELERMRIEAGTPRYGREIDDRVLPAEAGLVERTVSFTKGCYPGQEPIARLNYRGHPNRLLRVLRIDGAAPDPETEILFGGKAVGRITSSAATQDGAVALGYVRTEVAETARLSVGGTSATIVPGR
jgi:folate-binding protein YgfZ